MVVEVVVVVVVIFGLWQVAQAAALSPLTLWQDPHFQCLHKRGLGQAWRGRVCVRMLHACRVAEKHHTQRQPALA
jgi:hypothetical protein